jgi:hypothetical protein
MFPATSVPPPRRMIASCRALVVLALVPGLGGCITVKAPEKPIVIELNVTIKQEVIYRLAGDAAQTIDKNAEIF